MHEKGNSHKDNPRQENFKVLDKNSYLKELHDLIPQAQRRVWIETLTFDPEGPFLDLKDLLKESAGRGVDTRFTVDRFHQLLVGGSLYYQPHLSTSKREAKALKRDGRRDALIELENSNVNVLVTNPPKGIKERINPARGRNHIKMAIIDDTVFFGDIQNMVSKNQPGIMIKITEPQLVEGFAQVYEKADRSLSKRPLEIPGTDDTSILFDTPTKGESVIMQRSIDAVNSAKRQIKITGQHTPDGEIMEALQSANDRGVAVSMLIAEPKTISSRPLSRLFDVRSQLISKSRGFSIPILEVPYWVHSNVLLIDQGSMNAQAVVGTRCYSDTLVRWGTGEVALKSTNSNLLGQLNDYIQSMEEVSSPRAMNRTLQEIIFQK